MIFYWKNLKEIGSVFLFAAGIIFLFYALFVPAFLRGVHWLITLGAILFLVALPAIYHSFLQVQKVAAKIVGALLGVAMVVIIVADILFALSFISRLNHDLAYALGNGVFTISQFAIGVTALKGRYFKWFGDLSILTAIVGFSTYFPQVPSLLSMASLLILGAWSLTFGFVIRKLSSG
jgi:hypothetical protein